jgi:hypothetical protein
VREFHQQRGSNPKVDDLDLLQLYFGHIAGWRRTAAPHVAVGPRPITMNVNEPALDPKNEGFGQKTRTFDARVAAFIDSRNC